MALSIPPKLVGMQQGWVRACNALGLEEAALHGGATEAPTSRRWEWRGKSTFCRPKDISKHICVLAQPVLMPLLIGLECGQSKCTSTARMPPYNKWPQWKLTSFYSVSREGTMSVEEPQERTGHSGEQFDGNIGEEYGSGCLWHCYENE